MKKIQIPSDPKEMLDYLGQMSDDELKQLWDLNRQFEDDWAKHGPKNPLELHEWIRVNLDIDVPRTAVCSGHVAPFEFLSDLYFGKINAALGVGPRGGGKTFMVAVLHWLNAKFKPGSWGLTFGAVDPQSFVAYNHLKNWIYDEDGNYKPEIVSSLMKETVFKNTSKVSVLGTTPEQVNGPHPQVAHADEIELMREDTWRESRNMTVAKTLPNGLMMMPQDVSTSTRKGPNGKVQELIDEIDLALKEGMIPPRKLYLWCQKETATEIPMCQMAPKEAREARLKELGMNPCELCDCDKIAKGYNEDGSRRKLTDVCQGDFFKSRGWQPFADIQKAFTENDVETYEAQILCQKPEMKWHYLPTFSEERHVIKDFVPDPGDGPIFTSTDWGGTAPHAVHWYQLLKYGIDVMDFKGNVTSLKEGTLVCFDEIYMADISSDKLGRLVKIREIKWAGACADLGYKTPFTIYERYADPQGVSDKLRWKELGLGISWRATREKEPQFDACRELVCDDNLFRVDQRCDMWIKEAKAWRRDEKTGKEVEDFNHAMADFRYMVINLIRIRKKLMLKARNVPDAKKIPRKTTIIDTRTPKGPVNFKSNNARNEYDEWRKSLGEPVTHVRNNRY